MKNIEAYIDNFKMNYESFIIGCDSIEETELWNKEELGEMEAFYSNDIVSIIIRLIASDGKIKQKEADYLNITFGFDYTPEELQEVYDNSSDCLECAFDENFENGITYMRKINTRLADAYKSLLSLICRIIVEGDGVVAESEIAEIKRLEELTR